LTHALYLEALREYLARGGGSRGSFLVLDPAGEKPAPTLEETWRFRLATPEEFPHRRVLELRLDEEGRPVKTWVEVRPVPEGEGWFENVWNAYRRDEIVR
jgi:hypothetical protein